MDYDLFKQTLLKYEKKKEPLTRSFLSKETGLPEDKINEYLEQFYAESNTSLKRGIPFVIIILSYLSHFILSIEPVIFLIGSPIVFLAFFLFRKNGKKSLITLWIMAILILLWTIWLWMMMQIAGALT